MIEDYKIPSDFLLKKVDLSKKDLEDWINSIFW